MKITLRFSLIVLPLVSFCQVVFSEPCLTQELSTVAEIQAVYSKSTVTQPTFKEKTVTAVFYDDMGKPMSFAIQDYEGTPGIRVISRTPVSVGKKVNVTGVFEKLRGERVLKGTSVTIVSSGAPVPKPMCVRAADVGGGSNDGQQAVVDDVTAVPTPKLAKGINNTGLYVKLFGRVTASVNTGTYDGYFYISDGAIVNTLWGETIELGIRDGSGHVGIRCRPPADNNTKRAGALPAVGDHVEVTGVVGTYEINGLTARYLWTTNWKSADMSTYTVDIPYVGFNLLSLPGQPVDPDPLIVFQGFSIDGMLFRWDSCYQGLDAYNAFEPDWFEPVNNSTGYWLNATHAGTIRYLGYTDSNKSDKWISVCAGWNILGMPFTHNTKWDDWKATDGTLVKSIQTARGQMLSSEIYGWDPVTQTVQPVGLNCDQASIKQLNVGRGYWVRTYRDIALIAPSGSEAP